MNRAKVVRLGAAAVVVVGLALGLGLGLTGGGSYRPPKLSERSQMKRAMESIPTSAQALNTGVTAFESALAETDGPKLVLGIVGHGTCGLPGGNNAGESDQLPTTLSGRQRAKVEFQLQVRGWIVDRAASAFTASKGPSSITYQPATTQTPGGGTAPAPGASVNINGCGNP